MDTTTDRRRHERYTAEEGAFVFFGLQPAVAGKVLDVGRNGLGFTYLASKRLTGPSINLSLMSTHRSFHCPGLEGKTVSDFQVNTEGLNGERRCGIQFEHLTDDQRSDLEGFISHCTVGQA